MSMAGSGSSSGWGARFPIVAFLVTLCVVAGVKLVRSGRGSLMQDGENLSVDWNDPFWELFALVAAFVIGIVVPLWVMKWKERRAERCTDFTHAFDRPLDSPRSVVEQAKPLPMEGEMLVPDASVSEVAELSRLFELQEIRFVTRQTYIDNAFHWYGNGGMGTRMCVIVHPDDVARARPIIDKVLNPPMGDGE